MQYNLNFEGYSIFVLYCRHGAKEAYKRRFRVSRHAGDDDFRIFNHVRVYNVPEGDRERYTMALGAEAQRRGESFKWYEHGAEVCYWWIAVADIIEWGLKKNKQDVSEADITEEYLSDLIGNALT